MIAGRLPPKFVKIGISSLLNRVVSWEWTYTEYDYYYMCMFAQNMLKYAYSYTPCANYYLTLLVLFIWNNTNVYILIYRLIFALSFSLTYTRISITKFVIPMPPKNEVFVYSFAFFFFSLFTLLLMVLLMLLRLLPHSLAGSFGCAWKSQRKTRKRISDFIFDLHLTATTPAKNEPKKITQNHSLAQMQTDGRNETTGQTNAHQVFKLQ